MDNIGLAQMRVERAIKLAEEFDNLSEHDLKNVFNCLVSAMELMPNKNNELLTLYYYVQGLSKTEIKKYGAIFKCLSDKNSLLINKKDLNEIVWRVNSLFF